MLKHGLTFLVCALVALSGCKRRDNTPPPPKNEADKSSGQHEPGPVTFDSCSLITNQEVEAIEGSPVKDAKNSGRSDAGLSFAQCFYTTEQFNRSVSLAITQADPNATPRRSIKEYWEGMFGKYENDDKEREHETAKVDGDKEKSESLREQKRERGEEHESVPPKKVEGIGDEAFWISTRVGGALYILRKEALLRISVGGPDPEDQRIEKCKALGQKALTRLPKS